MRSAPENSRFGLFMTEKMLTASELSHSICVVLNQLLKRFNWVLIKDSSKINLYESIDLHKYYYCVDSRYVTPRVLIDKMLSWDFDLNAAYSMKEEYAYINRTSTSENAEKRLENYIGELTI